MIEWEVSVWSVSSHSKRGLEGLILVFYIIRCLPGKWLRYYLALVNIKETASKITFRTGIIKCIAKLKAYFNLNHIIICQKPETISVNNYKGVIWRVSLIVIKPLTKVWITKHSEVKWGICDIGIRKTDLILFLSTYSIFCLTVNYRILRVLLTIYLWGAIKC